MIGRYSDQMTYEYILTRLLERVPDTVDKREGSVIFDALAPAAAEISKTYMELDVVMDETFVDTASLQYLMLRCKERGIKIQSETAAVIQGTFTPVSVELTAGMRFNCDEVNYSVTDKVSPGLYRLEAETLGVSGNKYSGALIPIQTVNGLQSAEITGVLIPGENGDTTDTLREKYYATINSEAFGGNVADYKEKANAITGVGGVKCARAPQGGGTVGVTIISSDFTVPSAELIAQVQTALDPAQNHGEGLGLAPIGHSVTVSGVSSQPVAVQSAITLISGWTWEDAKTQVEAAVSDYFSELAEQWQDSDATVVRISQIETRVLALSCVLDVADTTLNGASKNLQIDENKIPTLSDVEVTV